MRRRGGRSSDAPLRVTSTARRHTCGSERAPWVLWPETPGRDTREIVRSRGAIEQRISSRHGTPQASRVAVAGDLGARLEPTQILRLGPYMALMMCDGFCRAFFVIERPSLMESKFNSVCFFISRPRRPIVGSVRGNDSACLAAWPPDRPTARARPTEGGFNVEVVARPQQSCRRYVP